MRLVSKRHFQIEDPITVTSLRCRDALFRNDHGEFILHVFAEGRGERLLRLGAATALAWLNAPPDHYGIEWSDHLIA